ncbi:putative phosphatidate phosphatase isoform X1 [Tribolium castaneum]|uniref:Phosphatidate phosphatase-like Protein n=2 Tax=Tribolium castaneum TaxID=7070 RepID=D6WU10_TRICA|nr:PREDICTED: putative phosphatidate phosphatase isoform X1 [Tribolium castaneum]EFA07301.1 Putative phosphatidate phosphatase-like Protein [Tribolium castaneum]|eukprot:XP_015836991.1 PREDICTED: putative phosphatidate phosphatase isoform X1 [Tribolium castaneum]
MASERETIIVPGKKILLDVFLVALVGFPILFIFLWLTPYRRGFFCNDEDLMHPYHPSTVPSIYLYIVGIIMNCTVMILIEFLNQPQTSHEVTFWKFRVPFWFYNVYYVLLVFAFGMACSQLSTDIMKYTVGRLRPHFLTVCKPDINCSLPSNQHVYHVDFNCTNKDYIHNARIMKEMRLSFPSGHSSFSMYTMLYFAIYLQRRMDWDGSKLLKHMLQFLAVAAAVFVAMTRISDNKHHWSDVLSGLVIGTIVACVTARVFSTLFQQHPTQDLVRKDFLELQGVNGNNAQTA